LGCPEGLGEKKGASANDNINARSKSRTHGIRKGRQLGISIKREEGVLTYRLRDAKGEPVCIEYDAEDAAQSIAVYAGSHPGYTEARIQYAYATGEDH
jgi:hypothetical protein